jgi:hypothetical protein
VEPLSASLFFDRIISMKCDKENGVLRAKKGLGLNNEQELGNKHDGPVLDER